MGAGDSDGGSEAVLDSSAEFGLDALTEGGVRPVGDPPRRQGIEIGPDGCLRVLGRSMERRLRDRAGRYDLVADAPGLLVLRRIGDLDHQAGGQGAAAPVGARVLMAGEIISRMSMLEIINVIANAGWRGDLQVIGSDDVKRILTFDQGALKYTQSSHRDDRLGEVLYRNGIVSRQQLDALLREVTPDKRFGQLCVERAVLSQEDLFTHLHTQAEHVFYNTLITDAGTYLFCLPDDSGPPPAHTVHIPVQALLMEGVQRIDEMALFRQRIPSSGHCPEVKLGAPNHQLEPTSQTILAYCDGSRTIDDIARASGLGEFETTKTIYHLLQRGQVTLRSGVAIDQAAVRRLVAAFNEVMVDIFMAVATYGGVADTRATLGAWIEGSGYGPYFGGNVDEDGTIDAEVVLASLERLAGDFIGEGHPHPVEALHQALHEMVAFALFAATANLPRDQELELARDVNRRLKVIRI